MNSEVLFAVNTFYIIFFPSSVVSSKHSRCLGLFLFIPIQRNIVASFLYFVVPRAKRKALEKIHYF